MYRDVSLRWACALLAALWGSVATAGQARPLWYLSGKDRAAFEFVRDDRQKLFGDSSVRLSSKKAALDQTALVYRRRGAADFRGRRVRLTGHLRGEGLQKPSVVFAQVISQSGRQSQSLYGWAEKTIDLDAEGWQSVSLVLEVPVPSRRIIFGFQQVGPGITWGDNFKLEVIDDDTPLVGYNEIHRTATNTSFVDEEPTGLPLGWETRWTEKCSQFSLHHTPGETRSANELSGTVDLKWQCENGVTAYFFQNISAHRYLGKPASVTIVADFEGPLTLQAVLESTNSDGLTTAAPGYWTPEPNRSICVDLDLPRKSRTVRYGLGVAGQGSAIVRSIHFASERCALPVPTTEADDSSK